MGVWSFESLSDKPLLLFSLVSGTRYTCGLVRRLFATFASHNESECAWTCVSGCMSAREYANVWGGGVSASEPM